MHTYKSNLESSDSRLKIKFKTIQLLTIDVEENKVAIVQSVVWSTILGVCRRSRIWAKQDSLRIQEMYEIWS